MKILRRLFGSSSARMDEESLRQLLMRFVGAQNAERRSLVSTHPELLSPEMDQFVAGLIWRQKGEGAREMLEYARQQLSACRKHGPQAAFDTVEESPPADGPSPELVKIVHGFITAPGELEGKKAFLLRHPELLGPEADEVLQRGGDERTTKVLEGFRALLERCRQVGIEQAFLEQSTGREQQGRFERASAATMELMKTDNPAEWERIIRAVPDVIAEDNEKLFRAFAESGQIDERIREIIVARAELLRRCREEGLDRAFENELSEDQKCDALLHELGRRASAAEQDPSLNPRLIAWTESLLERPEIAGQARAKGLVAWTLGKTLLREQQDDETALAALTKVVRDLDAKHDGLLISQIWKDAGDHLAQRTAGDRESNQTRAFAAYLAALDHLDPKVDPKQFAAVSANLALLLTDLVLGDPASNREEAMRRAQAALDALDEKLEPATHASIRGILASTYAKRLAGRRSENLATAITHFEESLRVLRGLNEQEACISILVNLANVLLDRAKRSEDGDADIERAIDHLHTVLGLADKAKPSACAIAEMHLAKAYAKLGDDHSFEPAKRAPQLLHSALGRLDPNAYPDEYGEIWRAIAGFHFDREQWNEALAALDEASAAIERLYSLHYFRAGRSRVSSTAQGLYDELAYCLIRLGRLEEAIETIEKGRTRYIREQLQLRAPRPADVPDDIWDQYSFAAYSLRNVEWEEKYLPGRPEEKAAWFDEAAEALDSAIAAVRAFAPDFCIPARVATYFDRLLPADTAAILVCVTRKGGAALVLRAGHTAVVCDLPAVTTSFVARLLFGDRDHDDEGSGGWIPLDRGGEGSEAERWPTRAEAILAELGEHCSKPIAQAVPSDVTHLVLVVPGRLSLLPIHAAPFHASGSETLWGRCSISYAPALAVLAACEERWPPSGPLNFYAIANPTHDSGLPFAALEGDLVRRHFSTATVDAQTDATREKAARGITDSSVVHFACHARFDWRSPRSSGLCLADGILAVDELLLGEITTSEKAFLTDDGREVFIGILIRPEKARLAVLSACETALIDLEGNPDEFIGVPAGFLLSGIPSVVSSLWSVSDISTALLMDRFYTELAAGSPMATALRDSSLWLRDATAGELTKILARERDRIGADSSPYYEEVSSAWRRLAAYKPDARPFAEPFHYAAFVAIGSAWRQVFQAKTEAGES